MAYKKCITYIAHMVKPNFVIVHNNKVSIFVVILHTLDPSDILLLLLLLHVFLDELDAMMIECKSVLASHIREQRRLNRRSLPESKKLVPWSDDFCN